LLKAAFFLETTPADLLGWWGKDGALVNADCLRVALAGRPVCFGSDDGNNLRAMRDLAIGMTEDDPGKRRDYLRRVLVRVVAELTLIDTVVSCTNYAMQPVLNLGETFSFSRKLTPDPAAASPAVGGAVPGVPGEAPSEVLI
jgi:hypothetical protein